MWRNRMGEHFVWMRSVGAMVRILQNLLVLNLGPRKELAPKLCHVHAFRLALGKALTGKGDQLMT